MGHRRESRTFVEFLEETLKHATEIALRSFGKVRGTVKQSDPTQVVTETDLAIGRHFIERIHRYFPDHSIVDEEAGVLEGNSEYTWVIDPIDGTSNFAAGVPTYGVMAGLLKGDEPVAGGVALPSFGQIAIAEKEKGAFVDGKRARVTDERELRNCLVAYEVDGACEEKVREDLRYFERVVMNARNVRASSSVFDIAMVAEGKYGGILNRTTRIWDNVAPDILIVESGGLYTDFFGLPLAYSHPLTLYDANYTVCAGAPLIHAQLQKLIHG
jgi:myo-inositol-1(or 4)-monophosphatase